MGEEGAAAAAAEAGLHRLAGLEPEAQAGGLLLKKRSSAAAEQHVFKRPAPRASLLGLDLLAAQKRRDKERQAGGGGGGGGGGKRLKDAAAAPQEPPPEEGEAPREGQEGSGRGSGSRKDRCLQRAEGGRERGAPQPPLAAPPRMVSVAPLMGGGAGPGCQPPGGTRGPPAIRAGRQASGSLEKMAAFGGYTLRRPCCFVCSSLAAPPRVFPAQSWQPSA